MVLVCHGKKEMSQAGQCITFIHQKSDKCQSFISVTFDFFILMFLTFVHLRARQVSLSTLAPNTSSTHCIEAQAPHTFSVPNWLPEEKALHFFHKFVSGSSQNLWLWRGQGKPEKNNKMMLFGASVFFFFRRNYCNWMTLKHGWQSGPRCSDGWVEMDWCLWCLVTRDKQRFC